MRCTPESVKTGSLSSFTCGPMCAHGELLATLICLVDAARIHWRISSVPLTHSLYFTIHSLYFTSRLLYELAALCHSMIVSNIILDTVPNLPGGKRAEPHNIAKGSSYLQSICGIFKGLLHLTRSEVSQVACGHLAHSQQAPVPLTLRCFD